MAQSDGTPGTPGGQPDGGNGVPGWVAQLPDPMKAEKSFTSFKTLGDFAGDYMAKGKELETLKDQVANSIPKLTENATDEQKTAYFKALGVPEKPTEYEFPKTDGADHDPKMIEWAQKTFHDAHLSKEQGALIGKAWNGFVAEMVKAQTDADTKGRQEAEATLKKELGDKYAETVELTARLLKETATPEELKFLQDSKLGNHPALVRLIAKLAAKTGEDSTGKGNPARGAAPSIGMNYTMPQFK